LTVCDANQKIPPPLHPSHLGREKRIPLPRWERNKVRVIFMFLLYFELNEDLLFYS